MSLPGIDRNQLNQAGRHPACQQQLRYPFCGRQLTLSLLGEHTHTHTQRERERERERQSVFKVSMQKYVGRYLTGVVRRLPNVCRPAKHSRNRLPRLAFKLVLENSIPDRARFDKQRSGAHRGAGDLLAAGCVFAGVVAECIKRREVRKYVTATYTPRYRAMCRTAKNNNVDAQNHNRSW